ncbi:MAG: CCA tRNA nucleotidyltransferase [Pseudomonadota bacterium]
MGRPDEVILPDSTAFLSNPAARAVLDAVQAGGHEILFVGGCVRNALLDVAVSDIDMATSARPYAVVALAEAAGLRVVPTGLEHGTVTVVVDGQPIEVTTYRRDVETDGRHATVKFADTHAEDAQRRDFTINGLYCDAHGRVLDPVGGLADIAARRVRFIGDAAARIAEDRLRMLRFFRFTAWYGDPAAGLDPEALAAIASAAQEASALSAERIGAELLKLLTAPDPAPALAAMQASGLGGVLLPGSDAEPLAPLVHVEGLLKLSPDPLRRLAALTGEASHLRLSRAQLRQFQLLRDLIGSLDGPAELAYRHSAQVAWDVSALRVAMLGGPVPIDVATDIQTGAAARFPVKASDLPLEGKALGDALKRAEAAWIASRFTLTRSELIARAQDA